MATLLIENAAEVVTLAGPARARVGEELAEPAIVAGASVFVRDGLIEAVGTGSQISDRADAETVRIDAGGMTVAPGFVDAHTHPVFAGWRAAEYELRVMGATYEEIAAAGGGISDTGFGPAASKVYAIEQGLSIGGYGEMVYQGFAAQRDDGVDSGRKDELDFLRAVLYVGYKWNDDWLFNSEIEWEHAKAGEGQRGEVAVEFAYLERRIRPEINVRAGLLLVPMGFINELHEPTTYLGAVSYTHLTLPTSDLV